MEIAGNIYRTGKGQDRSSKHSFNNFTFQVFKTSWENKGNPRRAARNGLDKATGFSTWTGKHLLKKKAMKALVKTQASAGLELRDLKLTSHFVIWIGQFHRVYKTKMPTMATTEGRENSITHKDAPAEANTASHLAFVHCL